ncbi:NAD-dependent protein deacetylase of SIR2 family [Desulfurella amilsii]|uniref:protein acetyllysine N-acetyltransferase n=1 Tax=Desulfurella amilsii TaxID=1562698 RepID=A0A1X4XVM4_9BACT|nr:NAD-dependent deacylase [Desulfurella amilsii]OSS41581.1 NAD-dependent protein deacetylase of SIR2 family [Desulfurella amilsii]
MSQIKRAAYLLKQSKFAVCFTGAGISVESGVPSFRGEDGLWEKYDQSLFEIDYFYKHPEKSWALINRIFFEVLKDKKPNKAHYALAKLEELGYMKAIITQNIDNLHYLAGSKNIIEYHGNSRMLVCGKCAKKFNASDFDLSSIPLCPDCKFPLKPDFVFFGEMIPKVAQEKSEELMRQCDLLIVIGTSGLVYPAAFLPMLAHKSGAKIIEINKTFTEYTDKIVDVFLEGSASEILKEILIELDAN